VVEREKRDTHKHNRIIAIDSPKSAIQIHRLQRIIVRLHVRIQIGIQSIRGRDFGRSVLSTSTASASSLGRRRCRSSRVHRVTTSLGWLGRSHGATSTDFDGTTGTLTRFHTSGSTSTGRSDFAGNLLACAHRILLLCAARLRPALLRSGTRRSLSTLRQIFYGLSFCFSLVPGCRHGRFASTLRLSRNCNTASNLGGLPSHIGCRRLHVLASEFRETLSQTLVSGFYTDTQTSEICPLLFAAFFFAVLRT
jgi:hypothetical protein